MDQNPITYFGETDARNKKIKFGIKAKDRLKHIYIVGKTGMGKSTLLENMAVQDIQGTNGIAFMDPHGGTAEKLMDYVPESRMNDVIYFAPFDTENPISFNLLEDIGENKRHLVVNGLMATFEKIWADAWSARMAYILSNTLYALLETPGSTLLGVNRMYSDKAYRNMVVGNIKNVSVKNFWTDEYAKYSEKFATEATAAIQNKVGQFTSNSLVRNIIGQSKSTFDIRTIMDQGKILIVNLSKGQVGDGNANLLGSMLITKIYLAALSRADLSETELNKMPNFYLYVDEFQSFANKSFANILSEARKYKLNLTIAHQYIEQMEEEVRDAVFGNVGTMITFRVGAFDAEVLEKEFAPVFTAEDLVNLGFTQIYLKLMINGVSSQPFSATTMGPIAAPPISYRAQAIQASRKNYAKPKAEVEAEIAKFHDAIGGPMPQPGGQGSGQNNYQGGQQNGPRQYSDQGQQGQQQFGRNNNSGNNFGNNSNNNSNNQLPPRPLQQPLPPPSSSSVPPLPQPIGPERELPAGTHVGGQMGGQMGGYNRDMRDPRSDSRNPHPVLPDQKSAQDQNKMAFAMAAEQLKKMAPQPVVQVQTPTSLPPLPPLPPPVAIPPTPTAPSISSVRPQPQFQSQPISLADLKPEHEKAKIPTKENVSSLKDALSAVLAQKAPAGGISNVAPVSTPQPQIQTQIQQPPLTGTSTQKLENNRPEAKTQNPQPSSSQPLPSRPEPIREVPEDVLRKLLSLDEPVGKR